VNGFINIPDTKTDTPKIIPMHPQLKPYLQKAVDRSQGEYVFSNHNGKIMNKNRIRDKIIQICAKVGIPPATVHDFRHTFASQHGLSRDARQKIGGWSSRQVMEKTYIHTPEERLKQEYFAVDFANVLS
jgi:integrase